AAQPVRIVSRLRPDAGPGPWWIACLQPSGHQRRWLRSADPARTVLRLRDPWSVRDAGPRGDHRRGRRHRVAVDGGAIAAAAASGRAIGRLPRAWRGELRLVDSGSD